MKHSFNAPCDVFSRRVKMAHETEQRHIDGAIHTVSIYSHLMWMKLCNFGAIVSLITTGGFRGPEWCRAPPPLDRIGYGGLKVFL